MAIKLTTFVAMLICVAPEVAAAASRQHESASLVPVLRTIALYIFCMFYPILLMATGVRTFREAKRLIAAYRSKNEE